MIREIANLEEMRQLAAEIASRLPKRALVMLGGPMAAGKTQFTKFLIEALGSASGEAVSPSFALHHSYVTGRGGVEHFDLFRLESADDLESTGFWDFFRAGEGVIVIEWYERLAAFGVLEQLPASWQRIRITIEVSPDSGAASEWRRVTVI